jgi:hypothetical protein
MGKLRVKGNDMTITVRVPIALRKRGGRKLVIAPDGSPTAAVGVRVDNALLKAVARAFRWREMLENGQFATIREIAQAEKINESYVSRVLRLTLLAPDIVEAVLAGRQPPSMQLDIVLRRFSVDWPSQRDERGVI